MITTRSAGSEIWLPREYLGRLALTADNPLRTARAGFRKILHEETGFTLHSAWSSTIPLARDPSKFRINQVTIGPFTGLSDDTIMGNDSPRQLRAGWTASAVFVLNPVNGYEFAILDSKLCAEVENAGYTTWDATGYLVLCLSSAVRERLHWFLDLQTCAMLLHEREWLNPSIAKTVRARCTETQITRLLRDLLAEQVPIRNLRRICEVLADAVYARRPIC